MQTNVTTTDETDERAAVEAVLSNLGRAVGSLRCAGSHRLVRLGISMTHFHVLTLLRHHDAMPMGRVAEVLDASMSSATGIIDRMEERGLVERVRVPGDRRVVLVRSTRAGLDLVDEAELVKNEVMAAALARLSTEQLDRMAAAVADLDRTISLELASAPDHYVAFTQCEHTRAAHPERRVAPEAGTASPIPGPAGA